MPTRFHLFVALRHLVSRRRQTLLTVLGVAVGAMILITTLSMTEGLITDIEDTIIEASPHLVVKAEPLIPPRERLVSGDVVALKRQGRRAVIDKLTNAAVLDERVARTAGIVATSPFIEVRGILRYGTRFRPIVASGILPEREAQVSTLAEKMIDGRWDALSQTSDGIVIGRLLARNLGVKPGDRVRLVDPEGRLWNLRVVGIFKAGIKTVDELNAYMNIRQAQTIRHFPNDAISGINARSVEPRQVSPVAADLRAALGQRVDTWMETNRTVLASFRRNNQTTLILVVFTFIVSGFGISNVLNTVILEKVKDIAVLKSLGVDRHGIRTIFTLEGLLIGIAGALLGGLLGWGLSTAVGMAPVSYGDAAFIQTGRIAMAQKPWFYGLTLVFSMAIATFASRGPAKKAAELTPVAIFRGY